ncbi:MAG: radical SAM protein [Thermodesulfobacteriota bacterium]
MAAILARAESPASPEGLLPQRSLAPLLGRPVLAWTLDRLKARGRIDGIFLAVGDPIEDAAIVESGERLGLKVYACFPDNILGRLKSVVEAEGADHVVRVNGNFPLVDPDALDELVTGHLDVQADYSFNSHYHGLIYGLGVEVFARKVLTSAAAESPSREQAALGSLYLQHHPEKHKIFRQSAARTAPHLRVSVDFEPDLKVVTEILTHLPRPDNESIISFLSSRPDLTALQEKTAPAEVGLEKAMLFPEKMRALRRNNCLTFDATYPISVELSLTNRCNHHCVWCSDQGLRRRLRGELTRDLVIKTAEELKRGGVRGLVIEGGGEPTLHPDFSAITREIKELDLALGLITNGFILPREPWGLFEWIRVSLDAAGRDQYRTLKGVDGFDRVLSNLMAVAAAGRPPTLGVGYVLTNRNDDPGQLEQLVLFLRKIKVSYIHFRPVVDHPELTSRTSLDYLKKYGTDEFSVNISALHDNRETGNGGLPCLAHSLSAVIAADGSVFLCGRLNSHESWEALGNIRAQSFPEIWTGEKRRAQVRMVSEPGFCRSHCPQCRMTKYNKLLDGMEKIKTRNFI